MDFDEVVKRRKMIREYPSCNRKILTDINETAYII
jgi:hypothetical protein